MLEERLVRSEGRRIRLGRGEGLNDECDWRLGYKGIVLVLVLVGMREECDCKRVR